MPRIQITLGVPHDLDAADVSVRLILTCLEEAGLTLVTPSQGTFDVDLVNVTLLDESEVLT